MRGMKPATLLVAVLFLGCGGAQTPPPNAGNAPPPSLPPSMAGGSATPGGSDMPTAGGATTSGDLEQGIAAIERGDTAGAKTIADGMIKKNPKDGDAYYLLGLVDEREGRKADAEKAYKDALRLKPDQEGAAVNLGALFVDLQRYDDAITVSRAGLQKHADSAPLQMNVGVALASKGDQAGATKSFDEAQRLAPNDAMNALTYAHWLGVWKQNDAALAKLRAARPLAKDDVGMLAAIGHEMRGIGAFSDCVPTFDKAIAVRDAAELRTERALCKLGAKDNAGALADLQAAVQKEPSYPPAHFYLAGRLAQNGMYKESIAEYEAYLKLAPNGAMAKAAQDRIKLAREKMKK